MKTFIKLLAFSFFIYINSFAQHTITVDGDPSDWIGTAPSNVHGTAISAGEFIYKGTANDERTTYNGTQPSSNNDIVEVRFAQDGTYLYILVKMRDITNLDYPHLCFVFSNNGQSNQGFIGDDSKRANTNNSDATPLGSSSQHGIVVDIHSRGSGNWVFELFDGGIWYAPPNGGEQISVSLTNDVIEARIKLVDLKLNSSSTTNISFMTAPNRATWNNDGDGTAWGTDYETNGVDVMTPGASDDNALNRELNDGNVGYYVTLTLSDIPLPVELSNYKINLNGDKVILTWSTASEVQNYGWEIERSKVDKSTNKASSWQSIGFVKGAGNSNSPKEYSFIDNSALYGEYAYRLKQIDIDGSTSYSDELRVFVGKKPEVYDVKAFPNPFNPETKIRFELPEAENVKLSIYDLTGRLITTLVDEHLDEGIYEREFNGSKLSSGIYFTILQSKDIRIVRKMQLIK